jgi:hypothetical protein
VRIGALCQYFNLHTINGIHMVTPKGVPAWQLRPELAALRLPSRSRSGQTNR